MENFIEVVDFGNTVNENFLHNEDRIVIDVLRVWENAINVAEPALKVVNVVNVENEKEELNLNFSIIFAVLKIFADKKHLKEENFFVIAILKTIRAIFVVYLKVDV